MTNFLGNPLSTFQQITVKGFPDIFKIESNALSGIKKEFGEQKVISALNALIIDLIKFYAVGKNIGAEQVKETSRLILQDFYFLKIEDFKLFFDRMKSGHYGQVYDRMDGNVILVNLRFYCDERMDYAAQVQRDKHKQTMESESEQLYFLKVDGEYVREVKENQFEAVKDKLQATKFTYGKAYRLRLQFIKDVCPNEPDKVTIRNCSVSDVLIFDYLEKHAPHLLPKGEAYKRATNSYYEQRDLIRANPSLTDFEKTNKIRELAGLVALTESEYEAQEDTARKEQVEAYKNSLTKNEKE